MHICFFIHLVMESYIAEVVAYYVLPMIFVAPRDNDKTASNSFANM